MHVAYGLAIGLSPVTMSAKLFSDVANQEPVPMEGDHFYYLDLQRYDGEIYLVIQVFFKGASMI